MSLLIKNGRVIDPVHKIDGVRDIFIEGERISGIAAGLARDADTVLDASGKIVMPGLVDMHVHLREPGREDKETVESGTRAALKGGITTLLAMPNTDPAIDSVENARVLKNIVAKAAACGVLMCGAVTRGRRGEELVDITALKKEGIAVITDDGASVENEGLMFEALREADKEGVLVMAHCEDVSLSRGGVMNLGFISTQLGLRGISKASEFKRVERDIRLAEKTGAALHVTHVSCLESAELIARAKKRGLRVTADATPHHLCLTDEVLLDFDTNMKMNPPLRGREDVAALRSCLKNGVIDAVASDHAPHTESEKEIEFDRAAFGVTGLETALAVMATEFIATGFLAWPDVVALMSANPARMLGLKKGSLGEGCDADIVIFDPEKTWKVAREDFRSKSKNSAFLGRTLKGRVEHTIYQGKLVYPVSQKTPDLSRRDRSSCSR